MTSESATSPPAGYTVWVATSGEYSDFRVDAVFSTYEACLRASENEPMGFSVLVAVDPQILYRVHARLERPIHPKFKTAVEAPHIHTGDRDECFDCNPGHDETGVCRMCKRGIKVKTDPIEEITVWPWSEEYPVSDRPSVTSNSLHTGPSRWIEVEGGNRKLVEKALQDRIARCRAELEGIA